MNRRVKSQPLVTIITPFMRVSLLFFREAIESVLKQTRKDWELLLIDDGSDPVVSDLAKRYESYRPDQIRYLAHSDARHQGTSASRNLGLREARGDYICFLDADDILRPEALSRQISLMYERPNVAMVFGRTFCWYSWAEESAGQRKDYYPRIGLRTPQEVKAPHLLGLSLRNRIAVPAICNIMVRRKIAEYVGGFNDRFSSLYDDQVFFAKIWAQHTTYVVDECWSSYRRHDESITGTACSIDRQEAARLQYLQWLDMYLVEHDLRNSTAWRAVRRELQIINAVGSSRLARAVQRRFWKFINRVSGL